MSKRTLSHIKGRLARQSTWTAIGMAALALSPALPAYAVYLTALAGVSGAVKLLLPEDSTLPKPATAAVPTPPAINTADLTGGGVK